MSSNDARLARNTALTVLALVALRLVAAAWTPLTFDEAYYWMWSKNLAGGYYDHPPAVAYVIRAGTMIAGDTELGVRLVVDPAGAADEFCGVSRRRHPVRRHPGGGHRHHPAQRHPDGRGRHPDRDAGCAAAGGLEFRAVFSRQGAGDRPRRVVARGRRRGRCGAAVKIHRAVFRSGDPDLAGGGAKTAALVDLAMALSRRPRGAGGVCARAALERGSALGLLPQAVRPRQDREFQAGLHRRAGSDPDRIRNAAGLHPGRDGASRPDLAQCRRVCRADARQHDVLDHRGVFHLAFAACPRRGQLVRAGLSGVGDIGRRRRPSHALGQMRASASPISACAGLRRWELRCLRS